MEKTQIQSWRALQSQMGTLTLLAVEFCAMETLQLAIVSSPITELRMTVVELHAVDQALQSVIAS